MYRIKVCGRSQTVVVAIALFTLLTVPPAAMANHGSRTLDAEPETAAKEVDSTHTIVATVDPPPTFATGAVNIDFENEGGSNDPDGGATPGRPDAQCSIPAGQSSCHHEYVGTRVGTDRWRVWIDHDGLNGHQGGETEADPDEARNEDIAGGGNPGSGGENCDVTIPQEEPDCTDVVQVVWTNEKDPPAPATLDCDDSAGNDRERERNPSKAGPQSNETYACYAEDQYGDPARDADPSAEGNQEVEVKAEIENGVNDPDDADGASYDSPDYTCELPAAQDGDGRCQITATQGELEEDTADICFWIGDAATGAKLCADEPVGPAGEDVGDDLADGVLLSWEQRMAEGLDLEDEEASHPLGATQTVTAHVYDQFGAPFQGNTTVDSEFFVDSPSDVAQAGSDGNSPDSPDATCTTSNDSTCTFEFSQSEEPGLGLLCGWLGSTPTMSGSARNARGTCNEEGRVDEDDTEGEADAPNEGDGIDVVSRTWTNPDPATRLDCRKEWSKGLVRSQFAFRCTATNEAGEGIPDTDVDIEFLGTNSRDGRSFGNPDAGCRTDGMGRCRITHGPRDATAQKGHTYYAAWINADYDARTVELDRDEGRNERRAPGESAEPDDTDKILHKWVGGDRTVSADANKRRVSRGEEVRFSGSIDARASACEDQQFVKLKRKPQGDRRFTGTNRTATTGDDGAFPMDPLSVWKDTKFRIIAPRDGACEWTRSRTIEVSVG